MSGALAIETRFRRALIAGAGALVIAAALAFVHAHDPASHSFFPPCIFFLLTGLHCPGCGSTRAVYQLLHADFGAAFRLNPLLMLFYLPFLGFVAVMNLRRYLRHEPALILAVSAREGWTIVGLIVSFWVIRNTPVYPFM